MPGVVFSGSVDGHFRAYATADGKIIWDFNTMQPFETVNGVKGQGGSIDSAGPVIAGGYRADQLGLRAVARQAG